jgi:hypothetical protein
VIVTNLANIERDALEQARVAHFRFLDAIRAVDPGVVFDRIGDEILVHVTPGREADVEHVFAVFISEGS